ncbi:stage V sporulation protein AA [Paludifilum halophilum]|nr:stage V sporulation protein AA [Paludifilum halophilum]
MVYLQMRKRVEARPGQVLRVVDVTRLMAEKDADVLDQLPVARFTRDQGNYMVIEWMEVVRVIREHDSTLDIRGIGQPYTIVEQKAKTRVPAGLYVAIVWILLFIGSGLAIMNFHTDVSMKEVHQRIYYLLTGVHHPRPLLLQIPYSLGIGLGMVLFFNRLFKKKFNDEPSPLELEVFLYQENIDQYVIDHEKDKDRRKVPDGFS